MRESRTVHVVCVDAGQRQELAQRLARLGYEVHTFASVGAYVPALLERPDCVLADLSNADTQALAPARAARPDTAPTPIAYLACDADIRLAVRAMKAGAFDVVDMLPDNAVLADLVARAVETADRWREAHAQRMQACARLARLTPREHTIFERILRGERNKEIAAALDSQEATVKVHRSRLMRKLEARTLADLLQFERRVGSGPTDTTPEPHTAARVVPLQRTSALQQAGL